MLHRQPAGSLDLDETMSAYVLKPTATTCSIHLQQLSYCPDPIVEIGAEPIREA